MKKFIYEEYNLFTSFKDDFLWGISNGKFHFEKKEKIDVFLDFIIFDAKNFDETSNVDEEIEELKELVLHAIITDVIYECLNESTEKMRSFFAIKRNRREHKEILQEVFLTSESELYDEIKDLEEYVFSKKEINYWNCIPENIYASIPRISKLIYTYALKYLGESIWNSTKYAPNMLKQRELPLLVSSKKYGSNNKYRIIERELLGLFKTIKKNNVKSNPGFSLYLLNEKTNLIDLFLSTIKIKQSGKYQKNLLCDEDILIYMNKLVTLILNNGFYLKFIILTEFEKIGEFIIDSDFWKIYKKVFIEIKEELINFIDKHFKDHFSKLPEEIRIPYIIYISFCTYNVSYFDDFIEITNIELDEASDKLFKENEDSIKTKYVQVAFEYAHDIFARARNTYSKEEKNMKEFIMSEHPLFKYKNLN